MAYYGPARGWLPGSQEQRFLTPFPLPFPPFPFQNTTYVYDAAGNLTKKTDRRGRVTEYSYDAVGRQVEERWRPDGVSAVFHTIHTYYDAAGQVRGIHETDSNNAAAGTRYQYIYDGDGRVTSSRMAPGDLTQSPLPTVNSGELGDGLHGEQLLDWDSDGVSERADARTFSLTAGVPVLFSLSSSAFDATMIVQRPGGNSSTWLIDSNGGGGGNASLLFTPDTTGTWTVFVTSPALTTGAYTLEITANANPIVPTALVELDYAYDNAGNMLTASEDRLASAAAGLGGATTDSYDALNRLEQTKQTVDGAVTRRVDFAYRDDGSLNGVTRYADNGTIQIGTTNSFVYDGMGRLKGFTHVPAVSPAISYAWNYDPASRISQMTTPDGTTNSIGYDAADQVTGVDYTYQAPEGYSYDDNGNRTNTGYQTGTANRLLSDGAYRYVYDSEGNRTLSYVDADSSGALNTGDSDITSYAWDHRNRLTSVSHYTSYANYQAGTTDSVVQYTYDAYNRRILRKIDADGSGAGAADWFYNVYEGDNPALEIHDSNGLAAGGTGENAPHRQHRYLYGQAVDEVLASEDTAAPGNSTGTALWGLGDHEGTIRDIMNNSGTVVEHRMFDSFGKMTYPSAPATDFVFGYTGQALDNATELYDYWHRWYDPAVGRFASEDPSGFAAGDANLYRYVGNNPLANTDPTGLQSWSGSSNSSGTWGDDNFSLINTRDLFRSNLNTPVDQLLRGSPYYESILQEMANRSIGGGPEASWNVAETATLWASELSAINKTIASWIPDPMGDLPGGLLPNPANPLGMMRSAANQAGELWGDVAQVGWNSIAAQDSTANTLYQMAAYPVAEFTGVVNASYMYDNTNPLTGERAGAGETWLRTGFGSAQLAGTAFAIKGVMPEGMVERLWADQGGAIPLPWGDAPSTVGPRSFNLNRNDAVSRFGVYEIDVNGSIFKIGKANLNEVTESSGLPTRLHGQLRELRKIFGEPNVVGRVVADLGETTTAAAKAAEHAAITHSLKTTGFVPLGNWKSFKP